MLLEVTPERWAQQKEREARKRRELPFYVHIGGTAYLFTPTCEVPDNVAEVVVLRRKYLRVAKPEQHRCIFCNKELKSKAGRKAHERSCKEKQ